MANKQVYSLRFDPDLMARVDTYARDNGWADHHRESGARGGDHKGRDTGRTSLITGLLEALVEGRVTIQPKAGVNPFPAEEVYAGESPDLPITITAPAPPSPKGWFISEVQGIGIYNPRGLDDPARTITAGNPGDEIDLEPDSGHTNPKPKE
jgi:hypothetical protein